MKHRLVFEVDTVKMFDAVAAVGDNGEAVGRRLAAVLLSSDNRRQSMSDAVGIAVFGIELISNSLVPITRTFQPTEAAMKDWIVQFRLKGTDKWHTVTRSQTLYWTEETAKKIVDQSNEVDREGFEYRAIQQAPTGFERVPVATGEDHSL